ncbi:uncharacterized protein LOC126676434 [Mercurialis annua]|uniref:uncharacterized protein LOC126676434 n=1 Tax=Mercurialis annua TaxID=3986 RepID=UPI00216087D1|nr:uncharacterized protein LOC126676434 [Mercurialis annua]
MKLSSKPISSPGRAEKYPPPLMRFLRSNVGSRSRGRSRSSPMFVRKKNAATETQEPTSPKVTCMGQVRVNRSKQPKINRTGTGKSNKPRRSCEWMKNSLFCCRFSKKFLKPKCSRPSWNKWKLLFHCGFKRKNKREDCEENEPKFSNRDQEFDEEDDDDEDEENEVKVYISEIITPPRNAFLLTRSRSAPYRSSSLACRIWGSPLKNEETEQKQSADQKITEEEEDDDNEEDNSSASNRELLCKESDQETEEKIKKLEELEGSMEEKIGKIQELKTEEDDKTTVHEHPLILTRCKSEPARTETKLDPEISFWKKRRLGFT